MENEVGTVVAALHVEMYVCGAKLMLPYWIYPQGHRKSLLEEQRKSNFRRFRRK